MWIVDKKLTVGPGTSEASTVCSDTNIPSRYNDRFLDEESNVPILEVKKEKGIIFLLRAVGKEMDPTNASSDILSCLRWCWQGWQSPTQTRTQILNIQSKSPEAPIWRVTKFEDSATRQLHLNLLVLWADREYGVIRDETFGICPHADGKRISKINLTGCCYIQVTITGFGTQYWSGVFDDCFDEDRGVCCWIRHIFFN